MKLTLKAARANQNLTQSQAAKRIGVNQNTLSSWENGKSYPNAVDILKMEEVYGIRFADIVFQLH